MPCPSCGEQPHGMEHQTGRGNPEYEIGCLGCGAFLHSDRTIREHRVRGGLKPEHAVDAWNAGPDYWMTAPNREPTQEAPNMSSRN